MMSLVFSPLTSASAYSTCTSGRMSSEDFSLSKVTAAFGRVRSDDGGLDLREFVLAYWELNKFFPLLGRLMGFVASDVSEKISVLRRYRDTSGESYRTIQSMIKYEVDNNLTGRTVKPPSGSKTLLRLHRALDFVIHFFDKVVDCKTESLSKTTSDAYSKTLAHFHPWVVRKAVQVAVYMLPYRKELIAKLGETEGVVESELRMLSDVMKPIYEETQRLYTEYDLHEI